MVQFHWRIPIHGCKSDLSKTGYTRGSWGPAREGNLTPGYARGESDGVPYHDYMLEMARAAEIAGFDGALIPSFPHTDDPWVIAAAIARYTKTFRFMIAFQPPWLQSGQAAHAPRPACSASPADGCCSTSSPAAADRAALVGRPHRPRRPLSAHHRVPRRLQGRLERRAASATRQVLPGPRDAELLPAPGRTGPARSSTSPDRPTQRWRPRPSTPTSTSPTRAAGELRSSSAGCRSWPPRTVATSSRGSLQHHRAADPGGSLERRTPSLGRGGLGRA